ncbi:hypothetical protein [Streptomyces sp. S.PB5]|uniref:hypothetical protein n=1 Tax=Streptomyces sp. S.PB5 TaxID=3020844 RepID=UPI0025AF46DB|nr:hypothetical protein [Streptomyces sp. S.PB5]MDN3023587.1 hypothetical protein [Streptomyces sp. S.PB5]
MRPRTRDAASAVLIALACLLVPFGVLAAWATYGRNAELPRLRHQLTDPYVPFELAGLWLPVSALALAAAGIAVAVCRRRAVTATSLGTALGGAFLGLAVALGRRLTLSDLHELHRPAAGAVYDTLTATLRTVSWLLVALGLTAAAATRLTALCARRRRASEAPVADPAVRSTRVRA